MKQKQMILAGVLLMFSTMVNATEKPTTDDIGEPKGKAIIQVFTNFHSGFGTTKNERGFDLDRSYLGYEYALGKGLKVKGVMDIGRSSDVNDFQRIAYIKNAQLTWTHKNLSINGGLISTKQFGLQEKFWGNRYILKSFQDQYGFGHSADLGVSVDYKFTEWFSADLIMANGEGYKKIQVKDGLLYGAGITFTPVKGLTLRAYGSLNEAADKTGKDMYNLSTFVGYKNNFFSIGGEYNMVYHHKNISDNDFQGMSVYGSVKLSKTIYLFARYDRLFSNKEINKEKEENAVTGGVEFKACKYVKIAPNFRYSDNAHNDKGERYTAYISCYFGI